MIKSLFTLFSLLLMTQFCFAETCPNVSDIKNNALVGWKAYDSDDGKPLSLSREIRFKKMVEQFALAEWKKNKNLPNSIHCYYRDRTGSSLEAYLAKENFSPKNEANHFWYSVSGYMHCAAGKEQCQFETHHLASAKPKVTRVHS